MARPVNVRASSLLDAETKGKNDNQGIKEDPQYISNEEALFALFKNNIPRDQPPAVSMDQQEHKEVVVVGRETRLPDEEMDSISLNSVRQEKDISAANDLNDHDDTRRVSGGDQARSEVSRVILNEPDDNVCTDVGRSEDERRKGNRRIDNRINAQQNQMDQYKEVSYRNNSEINGDIPKMMAVQSDNNHIGAFLSGQEMEQRRIDSHQAYGEVKSYIPKRNAYSQNHSAERFRSEDSTVPGSKLQQEPQMQGGYAYKSLSRPVASYKSYKRQIVAVHSPKGGVGKTTITKELASAFGSIEVNGQLLKILIVDADWEFGDVATQLNVAPVPNVSEWVRVIRRDRDSLGAIPMYSREEIDQRYIIHYNENIDILAGSPNSMDAAMIDCDIISAIIDNLSRCDYDMIFLDNANSLKDTTVIPLTKADTIVLVQTLDTTTIQDTRNMLDTLRSIQFDFSRVRLVLNRVPEDDKKIDIGVAEVPRVLGLGLTAVIPEYDQIRLYNNSGEAAVLDKETSFSKEIKKLANTIMPVFDTKPKNFFARLISKFKKV